MRSLNAVHLIGHTGRGPEMRYAPNGQPVTTFSLATDRYASKPDDRAGPDWHRVVCWGKLAEFANQHLAKGGLVYIAGRLTYRAWTGQDGQPRHRTDIVASELVLLDRRRDAPPAEVAADQGDDDSLPF